MKDAVFERLVSDGIDALPGHIQKRLENIVVVIEDEPTAEQLMEQEVADGGTIFGLYEGVPLTERGAEYSALPDKVTIFKKPILASYTDADDIRQCVANTVWHEIAHHFGYDDPWIHDQEEKRGKTL